MKKDRHETIESTNDQKIARGVSKISGSLSINPMNTTIYIYIYSYLQIINNGYWSYVDQLIDFVAAGGAHIVANFGSR